MVAELLLQRTRADAVAAFIGQFLVRYQGWDALAGADPVRLEADLAPIGLQRRRATVLVALGIYIVQRGERNISDAPGIGQYVDRALRVVMVGEPLAMIDVNWVRIAKRVFGGSWMSDYRYDRRLQEIGETLVEASGDPRSANWAILDLGATTCVPRWPRCESCPLATLCRFNLAAGSK